MFIIDTPICARAVASALRDADALIARAIDLIGRADIEAETGLPAAVPHPRRRVHRQ